MQVILMEKIRHLGNVGDRVEVKGGYGRNYLLPTGKAVFASRDNVARFENSGPPSKNPPPKPWPRRRPAPPPCRM